jgi:hypothetical protein
VVISPVAVPAGYNDQAVDIGLAEEATTVSQFTTKHVFTLGTVRDSTGTYVSISRYSPDGTYNGAPGPEMVTYWPKYCGRCDAYWPTVRAAKAMTIPVVGPNTAPQDGRIFVLATDDGPTKLVNGQIVATANIAVLCYDFDLNLQWQKSYNYEPGGGFEGNDLPVAITTDQDPDVVSGGLWSYDFVAVLGSSETPSGTTEAVTMAFCKDHGNVILPPQREPNMPVPVSIAATAADYCLPRTIFITGGSNALTTFGKIITQGYQMPNVTCAATGNGTIPSGFPAYNAGSFPGYTPAAIPARIKYAKGTLCITGTTWYLNPDSTPSAERDMLTFTYLGCGSTPGWTDQWQVPEHDETQPPLTPYRAAQAVDMDTAFGLYGGDYVVITGSATSLVNGRTGVATMVYGLYDGQPLWNDVGAMWEYNGAASVDVPISVRCIQADDPGDDNGYGGFNAYVTAKTFRNGAFDYITLKYRGKPLPIQQVNHYKFQSWTQNFPFFNGSGNGDDIPARVTAESIWTPMAHPPDTSLTRRIWVAGTTFGGATANDCATQFIVEQQGP